MNRWHAVLLCSLLSLVSGSIAQECLPSRSVVPFAVSSFKTVLEFIMSMKDLNGWNKDTPRAVITMVLNGMKQRLSAEELQTVKHHLHSSLSSLLIRNNTSSIENNELALHINAMVALGMNPRKFYDVDLVSALERKVAERKEVNPLVVLTMCNTGALTSSHLKLIYKYIKVNDHQIPKLLDLKALSVKAFACAQDEKIENAFDVPELMKAKRSLTDMQRTDGSFGSLLTTSLAVQALIVSNYREGWNYTAARSYLLDQREKAVDVVWMYIIEMALHAQEYRFLKSYSVREPESYITKLLRKPRSYFIQYTLRIGENPDHYLTMNIKVPHKATIYDIMQLSELECEKFRFSIEFDMDLPLVYSIAGVANDAEESKYWHLYIQTQEDQAIREIVTSPAKYIPEPGCHIMYWYKTAFYSNAKF